MPGVCPNSWQTYGCAWTLGYLWRRTDLLERLALLGLALMLGHIVVTVWVSYCYFSARHAKATETASQTFQRNRVELVAKLSLWVDSLKSIASAAPYLGLAGTCLGILDTFGGYDGTRQGFVVMVVSGVSAAFLSTAAGLLVAIPAVVSYNYLRARIEPLGREISGNGHEQSDQSFQVAQTRPLTPRSSRVPFAVIAVPSLAVSMMAFMTFSSFHVPKGLYAGLASAKCVYEGNDRLIVLRLTDAGELFINQTQEDWNSLP
jgi:biopolymer transport protein ExbB/TolQ